MIPFLEKKAYQLGIISVWFGKPYFFRKFDKKSKKISIRGVSIRAVRSANNVIILQYNHYETVEIHSGLESKVYV